jgi:DNA polymerase (family 10)
MITACHKRIPLASARRIAERIAEALSTYCERIEIAGSIRRQRPDCGDIDLVCLPRVGGRSAMIARCLRNGQLVKYGEQYVEILLSNGVQLDLWFARAGGGDMFAPEPSNFGVLLLARTGSAMHNVWLAQTAQAAGLHFHPHKGVMRGREVIASVEEAEVFTALGLPYIPPEARER